MSLRARKLEKADKHRETAFASPIDEKQSPPDCIADIDPRGDLVLCISHETILTNHVHRFRVLSSPLKAKSKYFAGLLQGRFGESERVEARHADLRKHYSSLGDVPAAELPVVEIQDVGRISAVKSIEALCTDFLCMLHDLDTTASPPVVNLANVAIVADRFDALDAVSAYVRRKKMLRAIDFKTAPKVESSLPEEKVRQRLLVALLLDYPLWTEKYSARMILKGWVAREIDDTSALWWDLPRRIEEELIARRNCVLETIQSLELHFLKVYTSRDRQCRLGYDNSPQCDSFQLGEMLKFFSRIGAVQLRGAILDSDDAAVVDDFRGDLHALIDMLRQVPEYQIDSAHSHCGIRTRLVPILDTINECLLHVGICLECWTVARDEHCWLNAKRPLLFKRQLLRLRAGHQELHANIRTVFTAVERDWGT